MPSTKDPSYHGEGGEVGQGVVVRRCKGSLLSTHQVMRAGLRATCLTSYQCQLNLCTQ